MFIQVDYASPSALTLGPQAATLGLSSNRRRPVRFHGRLREQSFLLRIALRALGEAIWSNDSWLAESDLLDPVITVHPDRLFFEAFSQDQSSYVALIVDPALFEEREERVTGTTNIDFTAWLWGALGELRSSRSTDLRIGPGGVSVATEGAGGRFEQKVELPDSWVRGFLKVQAAMAMPGTRLTVEPVDLLAAIRYLRYSKARISPRALRYEFEPGEPARLVLEPWEHVIPLSGAEHNYREPKVTRVWGRRRLRLIEGLLPFADRVDIYLKGRALPSFYAVKLPGMTFLLGLTGFSASGFTGSGGFDALAAAAEADDQLIEPALALLRTRYHLSVGELAEQLELTRARAAALLVRLCRRGQCMFDVESRRYRHRELFEQPADERRYFPPDRRRELAEEYLAAGAVEILSCTAEVNEKVRKLKTPDGETTIRTVRYRDWRVSGEVAEVSGVEIVVNDSGRIIFGRCSCRFFDEHLLSQGPCEHMQALYRASESQRQDGATSVAADAAALTQARLTPRRNEIESMDEGGS